MAANNEAQGLWISTDTTPAGALSRTSTASSLGKEKEHAAPITRDDEILDLARRLTSHSQRNNDQSPFHAEVGGSLDPNAPGFRAREWAKAFYNAVNASAPRRVAGVAFRNLHVFGHGSPTDYQQSVGNVFLKLPSLVARLAGAKRRRLDILRGVEGLVKPGEMLCVLGPPGSGCSTLLKTIAGDTYGLNVSDDSFVNYHGIPSTKMNSAFRGEAVYTAEVDAHFPQLTVNETLYFAAMARTPYSLPNGVSPKHYAEHLRDVIMTMFGISHTKDTRVGNDFVRGVSGGERKRVTIAEATLSNAPLQCWDNSTRGLDSANAIEFCKTLRIQGDVFGCTSCVAIYQAPQAAYDIFDKVTLLYQGQQIYFGPASSAKAYFERLGFQCPASQTTPDFLTSMTNPVERIIRPGFEGRVPRTAEDFARAWQQSAERQRLLVEIEAYNAEHPLEGASYEKFAAIRKDEKSDYQRANSPYTLSYWRQIKLCMWRGWQQLKTDPSVTLVMLIGNFFEALIIASVFYNLPNDTSGFFGRGALLFMLVLLNAFGSILEIIGLYAKRTIVEKHSRYALYHPSAEAIASMILDLPYKIVNALLVNSVLYFMGNLRRTPSAYFFFLLISFTLTLSMSMFFRLFASLTKTIAQALAPSAIILLGMVLYTGFAVPINYMRGWASWMRWINPVSYGFESIMVNEFNGRNFSCSQFVPSGSAYEDIALDQQACAVGGARPGQTSVTGAEYVFDTYSYQNSNRWRNFGVLVGLTIALAALHLIVSELVAAERSKGEVLVFRRGKMQKAKAKREQVDEERTPTGSLAQNEKTDLDIEADVREVEKQTSVFHWQDVSYEIKVKGETRKILYRVDGWVKPGTLTALMGVSGAGKTTLLDVLASRTTIGVITGEMLVDGNTRDTSFQRKTGYVQQQDLHLHSSTVREALEFSALLRQPQKYSKTEKLAYVDTVISLLNMEDYADAVVGVAGSGLNVEQRKRLTIGVEMAARPSLLLFLDEPTSGLDSQTSWSICNLMEKLTRSGQAILCTIHQPSAMLFQRFDRLLLLAKGGKTVYFGDIGPNSRTLIDYFMRHGGPDCAEGVNPAEYMLETIGAAPGAQTDIDWPAVWRESADYRGVQSELASLTGLTKITTAQSGAMTGSEFAEFAAPFTSQLRLVLKRTLQQYFRSPSYIYSKALLTLGSAIFIGFSFFRSENTRQGLQNQLFGVFIFLFVVIQLILQIIPMFVVQRTLYESRERQSRTYHWAAFVLSNVFVELIWNTFAAIFCFILWYYPMGLYENAEWTDAVHSRGFLTFLFVWSSFMFASSFAHAIIAGVDSDEVASAIANILSIMLYAFCGILAGPDVLPGFWIFMYRVNPFTYLVDGLLSTTLGQAPVRCAANEYFSFNSPAGVSCENYMRPYMEVSGGYLLDPGVEGRCEYCPLDSTDQFLATVNADFGRRWRNFGLLWVYVAVNLAAAVGFYWLFRVPSRKRGQAMEVKKEKE
ncbi:uncharacterized protein HMPREF1541_05418 [Cyphellophora europaea CBS 101466]|uniref:ABC transporter domain-containing protein n=1 Tax=Cyphellophora europaea (strain CBS 101466) TaxID=1220924 RepID=W2RS99_CYPE1|nr:uncharacterized protein HMPREF1541_05418 [Cyphellophora europaea CBS 101466]ETN39195.1 hypothetical protein HMPREF1541_05418 [Cyphellophora europaea CBS 101466]